MASVKRICENTIEVTNKHDGNVVEVTIMALISTISGRPVARVRNWSRSESTNGKNALLLKERNGRLQVYSLALADLGMVLTYDPALAREAVLESQVSQTVPLWAKR
jgi:hypothetical protein